jgi:endonuclease-3 related protein
MSLTDVYKILLKDFGRQPWWSTKRGFVPRNLEICVGAILTQNTSWKNVEKSLESLVKHSLTTAEKIANYDTRKLQAIIRSSGFYKQKAKRLKGLCIFITEHKNFYKNVTREELLAIKGIGNETADSILLYACDKLFFVIDAYTRRIFSRLGLIDEKLKYDEIREIFEKGLPKDVFVYKEFHALIVEHAKKYCKKKPLCNTCPLRVKCKAFKTSMM